MIDMFPTRWLMIIMKRHAWLVKRIADVNNSSSSSTNSLCLASSQLPTCMLCIHLLYFSISTALRVFPTLSVTLQFGILRESFSNDNNNNNSSFILTGDNPQLIYKTLPRRTAQIQSNTIEEPAIIQPNITTRISMGGRQLQASAKVYHNGTMP